jgi:phage-related minor tail protein
MPTFDTLRRVTIRQVTEGGDAARRDLNQTTAAVAGAAKAMGNLAVVSEDSARRTASVGARFRQMEMSLDAAARASANLERGLRTANLHLAQNADEADRVAVQVARLNLIYDNQIRMTAGLTTAQRQMARAAIEAADAQERAAQATVRALNARLGARARPGSAQTEQAGSDFEAAIRDAERLRAAYDPLFSAHQRYKASLADLRSLLLNGTMSFTEYSAAVARVREAFLESATAQGLHTRATEEAARAATAAKEAEDARATAAQRAAQGWRSLGQGTYANAQASARLGSLSNTRGTVLDDAAIRAQVQSVDPMAAADAALAAQLEKINRLRAAGYLSQEQYTRSTNAAQGSHAALTHQLKRQAEEQERLAKGSRLTGYELQNLSYQVNDVASSLAAGISPMQTFAQQGGQIYQILAGSAGGVRGALKGIADVVGSAITRVGALGVAFGGTATATLAALVAWRQYEATQRDSARSVSGIGRGSGATVDDINRVAETASESGDVSRREARSMASEFAATGRIGVAMFDGLIQRANDYAKTTGQDMADASKELAQAFADPSRGVDILNGKLGGFNDRTIETVRRLKDQGDALGAQQVLFNALNDNVERSERLMSGWGRTMESIGNTVSNLWDRLGSVVDRVVTGGSLETQIRTAEAALAEVARQRNSIFGISGADADARERALRAELTRLRAQQQSQRAGDNTVITARNNREIMELARGLDPAGRELSSLQNQTERLRKAIADPVKFGLDLGQLAEVEAAFTRLQNLIRNTREDIERYGSVANANMVRSAANANANVELNPFERQVAERRQEYERQLRDANLTPLGRSREQINAEFQRRAQEPGLEAPQLQALEAERAVRLREVASREALTTAMNIDIDRINKQAEVEARRTAVSSDYIRAVMGAESSGDPNARNRASSATGLFQFIDSTWERLFRREFPARAQNMDRDTILAQRANRDDQMALMRALTEDNRRALERAGFATSNRNLYLAHFAGAQGAIDLLRNPEGTASAILGPRATAANPTVIPGRTAQQVIDWAGRTIERKMPGVAQQRLQNEQLGSEVSTTERTARAEAERSKVQELLNDHIQRGTELGQAYRTGQELLNADTSKMTETQRAQYSALMDVARGYGNVTQAATNARIVQEAAFDRKLIGMSEGEGRIATRLRGTGLGMDSAEAEMLRVNDALKEAKDLTKEAFSGIAGDLRRGVSAAEALSNVMNRIIDRLLNKGIDSLVSSLFDMGAKGMGSGGGIGSFFSSIGGALGFANGGYTGAGGRYEPAGVVHRGEYVFDAPTVSKIGVSALDAMRAQLKGYADGGYVTAADLPPNASAPPPAANTNVGGPQFNAQIVMQASGNAEADHRMAEEAVKLWRAESESMMAAWANREMSPGGMLHQAGARRAR